jgi:hypothetical protein
MSTGMADTQHEQVRSGVFALPDTHEAKIGPELPALKGATIAELDAEDAQDLPLIVWLRGDEPWFSQFDLDAEAVMKTLGIKRSRLTQISGKELRVGRVRMDRYIRPIYRSLDVEHYLSWTRATASHQKSSDAIKTAVELLQQQSEQIQYSLRELSSSLGNSIKKDLSEILTAGVSAGLESTNQGFFELEKQTSALNLKLSADLASLSENLQNSTDQTNLIISKLSVEHSAALEALNLQLNQISEKTALMEERLYAWDNMILSNLKSISDELRSIRGSQGFSKRKVAIRRRTDKQLAKQAPAPSGFKRSPNTRRKKKCF